MEKFVSAEWVEGMPGQWTIKAIGDDDSIWWVPSYDSDVPPWPQFREDNPDFPAEPPTT